MKSNLLLFPVALLLLALSGCIRDKCRQEMTYYSFEPVYMSFEEIRAAITNEPPRDLKAPGKIYFKEKLIFISEISEGIHVIDNTDPANPQPITFIVIPGNHDLAIKGDVLYADSYMDLVAIDITNPSNVSVLNRVEDVFPTDMHHQGLWADPQLGVAVDFQQVEVTQEVDCDLGGSISLDYLGMPNVFMSSSSEFSNAMNIANGPAAGGGEQNAGVGGSMARFTLAQDHLYVVTTRDLQTYSLSNPTDPNLVTTASVGWDIETIFPYDDMLFIGSMQGMFIYSLQNPSFPSYISEFAHVRSCDPVVVEGQHAFVTLRGGTPCGGFTNQLDVVNISDPASPWLEFRYDMTNPHGLGIRNGILFICDGEDGLKIYDATDRGKIHLNQLAHFPGIHSYDVIPLWSIAIMIGEDGLYQYDITDLNDITLLSHIPVVPQ